MNTPTKVGSSITPEQFLIHPYYTEDSENINPDDLLHSISAVPLDFVDGQVSNQSPIIRCSIDKFPADTNSPSTPPNDCHYLQISLFLIHHRSHRIEMIYLLWNQGSGKDIPSSVSRLREKRRRLTAYPSFSQSTASPTSSPVVAVPNNRRRRMTTLCPSVHNPITKYFKKNN
ncbi:unnamed protein product [Heterobilharzia americana]|nr:unnamed protein product [Heterobilharzia americana]